MDRFIYIRNTEDSAYVNSVSNFKGMGQGDASAKVELFFDAAASTASGNNFDKIILSVTNGKEKEAMIAIAGALAGSKSGSTAVIADEFGAKFCDDNILSVDSIALNTSATLNQVLTVDNVLANDTLTVAESGKTFVFNDADGAVLTLPDSGAGTIVGTYYDFVIGVTATSNAHKVVCADTTNEDMFGVLHMSDSDTSDATVGFVALVGDVFSAISSNGTTTGIQGSMYRVTNIAVDKWQVSGTMIGTGAVATPFATS
tara:strand:+ start:83 stop:856 length:774 start_codon:yes stop_codon:yes gene_type:complete